MSQPRGPSQTLYRQAVPDVPLKAVVFDLDGTLSALVESVRRNRAYNNEAARLACIALFNVLGPRSETAKRHQRALEMALF